MKRVLLDTQAFLWAAQAEKSLSSKARSVILNSQIHSYLSLVSLWEIQIKLGLGKLRLPVSLSTAVQRGVKELGIELLPLQIEHIYRLGELPLLNHRDPFDRLLMAQALYEEMPIVGSDKAFDAYGIRRIW